MASNGITIQAKRAKCKCCLTTKNTDYMQPIKEIRHGFAMGYWYICKNRVLCIETLFKKLNSVTPGSPKHMELLNSLDKYKTQ